MPVSIQAFHPRDSVRATAKISPQIPNYKQTISQGRHLSYRKAVFRLLAPDFYRVLPDPQVAGMATGQYALIG